MIGTRSGGGKSTRAEIPTPGLLGGKDLLCMVCRDLSLLTPARRAPYRRARLNHGGGECLCNLRSPKPGPQLRFEHLEEVRAPRPGPIPPITANRSAGPHSGDAHPFRRSGQLSAVATDAPVASTPPRRREPGR